MTTYDTSKATQRACTDSTNSALSRRFPFPDRPPFCTSKKRSSPFLTARRPRSMLLVEEQRRLIELLKEKRQAVISHAVTKGLDPNAPMKDSGVEWLGDVPAHWRSVRLGRDLHPGF